MAFVAKAGFVWGQVASNRVSQEISSPKPSMVRVVRCMSSSKIFVAGLQESTDDGLLKEIFSQYGQVDEARVIMDPYTGRSRKLAYVTYSSAAAAASAIQALDQQKLHGRSIRVGDAESEDDIYRHWNDED